jgi:hypothetical protein
MIIEMDMRGYFRWLVVDDELVLVDPKYLEEYETSVLNLVDNPIKI